VPSPAAVELAAGVLCWRRAREGLQVLLVHRPRYDDWSWPKGKVQDDEPLAVTAVREAAEETGLDVVLGRPLGEVRYRLPDGRRKQVTYWTATPWTATAWTDTAKRPSSRAGAADSAMGDSGLARFPPEVDALAWLSLPEARALLTGASDAEPLGRLEQYADSGVLATAPVLVVRHATSRSRDSWARAEADRPLVSAGRRQARGLVELLACWRPQRLVSSPWRRCVDTIRPYGATVGLAVHTKGSLSEDGVRRFPARACRQITRLLDRARPALLCTHRPVLAEIFAIVRAESPPEAASAVPTKDPYLAPAEVLVAHVALRGGSRRVVAVERHRPRS
jgi:8-oxo-(d)GTP phosphatase